jgi:hypothetical protein
MKRSSQFLNPIRNGSPKGKLEFHRNWGCGFVFWKINMA